MLGEQGRRLRREHRDAHTMRKILNGHERIEVGRVVTGDERARQPRALEQRAHRGALVRADRRQHLEHLAAEARGEAVLPCAFGELLELEHRVSFVFAVAEVERDRQAFQLRLGLRPRRLGCELDDLVPPALGVAIELEPVRADIDEPVHPDPLANVGAAAAADHRDEPVPLVQPLQLVPRRLRRVRVFRPRDDRREHAVEVQKDSRLVGCNRDGLERHPRSIGPWRTS